jgi:cell division protein FtsB
MAESVDQKISQILGGQTIQIAGLASELEKAREQSAEQEARIAELEARNSKLQQDLDTYRETNEANDTAKRKLGVVGKD